MRLPLGLLLRLATLLRYWDCIWTQNPTWIDRTFRRFALTIFVPLAEGTSHSSKKNVNIFH